MNKNLQQKKSSENYTDNSNKKRFNGNNKGSTKNISRITARVSIFLLLYIIIFLILAGILFIKLHITDTEINNKFKLLVVSGDKEYTYPSEDIYIDNMLYIPINALQHLTKTTTTKINNTIQIILDESNEYAKFDINTQNGYVNGNRIMLSSEIKYIDSTLYLPIDFFENHLLGVVLVKDEKELTYKLLNDTTLSISFLLKPSTITLEQPEEEAIAKTESPLNFKLDLSSYEQYMNPTNRDEYLFLVSPQSPLDENYIPNDLVGSIFTRSDGRATQKLREYACYALEAFLSEAAENGFDDITVTSGYRSYEYQSQLFQNEISIKGSAEEAAKSVNPPGSSEHQSGLCVDMHNLPSASTAFGGTPTGDWLEDNAHKFGFILRYPKNKVTLTGIGYEPWHFRYVGRYHATKMHELGMCLEEYLEYIGQ